MGGYCIGSSGLVYRVWRYSAYCPCKCGAGACDVGFVDAVFDNDGRAARGLGKRCNAAHTLFSFDGTRLVDDEIADGRAAAAQSAKEALQVLRRLQLEVHDAVSLPVELPVELRGLSHTNRRVCDTREVNVNHHLSPQEDVVAALVHLCREPFDIARVAEQIPAVLQGGWLIWLAAIGIGAYPVVVVIVCRDLSKCGEKTDETNDY